MKKNVQLKNVFTAFSTLFFFLPFVDAQKKNVVPSNKPQTIMINWYDHVNNFGSGHASVMVEGKGYTLINKQGREVIGYYNKVSADIKNGLVCVSDKDWKFGVLSLDNKQILPLKFRQTLLLNDYILVLDNVSKTERKYGLYSNVGNVILPTQYDVIQPVEKNKILIEEKGIVRLINEKRDVLKSYGNLNLRFYLGKNLFSFKENNLYGMMDIEGNKVLEPKYDLIVPFIQDFAKVRLSDHYGFINAKGEVTIPVNYEECGDEFLENLLPVRVNNRYGYIDINNNLVIEAKFTRANEFINGKAYVTTAQSKGFINKKGAFIKMVNYDVNNFFDGLSSVGIQGAYGFIDENSNVILKCDKNKKLSIIIETEEVLPPTQSKN